MSILTDKVAELKIPAMRDDPSAAWIIINETLDLLSMIDLEIREIHKRIDLVEASVGDVSADLGILEEKC